MENFHELRKHNLPVASIFAVALFPLARLLHSEKIFVDANFVPNSLSLFSREAQRTFVISPCNLRKLSINKTRQDGLNFPEARPTKINWQPSMSSPPPPPPHPTTTWNEILYPIPPAYRHRLFSFLKCKYWVDKPYYPYVTVR